MLVRCQQVASVLEIGVTAVREVLQFHLQVGRECLSQSPATLVGRVCDRVLAAVARLDDVTIRLAERSRGTHSSLAAATWSSAHAAHIDHKLVRQR